MDVCLSYKNFLKFHGFCLGPKPDNRKYDYSSENERGEAKVKPETLCIRNGAHVAENWQMK